MNVKLVPASLLHVGPLAHRMREADRIECEALGCSPKDALRKGLRSSVSAFTAIEGPRVLAMFGVAPPSLLVGGSATGNRGTVWFLAVEDMYRRGRALFHYGPPVLSQWLETFDVLENIVSVDNVRAIRMLKRWGFEIGARVETHRGIDFVPFRMERTAIQAPRLAA